MASETRMYSGDYKAIFDRCLKVVNKCGWNVSSHDESKGIIICRAGTTILSWGEEVSIHFSKQGNGIIVDVACEPVAQLIDWGKSEENIRTFYNWLEKS